MDDKKSEPSLCEPCRTKWEEQQDGKISATMHCIDCEENLCEDCSTHHLRQKMLKNHVIVSIEEFLKKEETEEAISSTIQTADTISSSSKTTQVESPDERNFEAEPTENRDEKTMISTNQKIDILPEYFKDTQEERPDDRNLQAESTEKSDAKTMPSTNQTIDILPAQSGESQKEFKEYTKKNKARKTVISTANREQRFHSLNKLLENEFRYWLADRDYSKLSPILQKPVAEEKDLENFWQIISPYLIQRIKMWNGNVVTPLNISSILQRKSLKGKTSYPSMGYSISRIDFLTLMLNAADRIVAQDIVVKLAKFHMTIPLVIKDITEEEKFIITLSLIKNIVIKCETTPGEIIENHLFSDKFRMIVAVRIGNNNIGKSTSLNQMMKKQHMFSSCVEPGSTYGRPQTLDGMVEMIWLTQDTCSDMSWKLALREHYRSQPQEVVILANLHGDALLHIDAIKYLAKFSSSFIVFQMPDCSEEKLIKLEINLSSSSIVRLLVNPDHNETNDYEIFTDALTNHETQETLVRVIEQCLALRQIDESDRVRQASTLGGEGLLRYYKTINCQYVDGIMEFVRKNDCLKIKQQMRNIKEIRYSLWPQELKTLIQLSMTVFCIPSVQAKNSLIYLETQLSELSCMASVSAQAEVRKAREKLRSIVQAPKKTTAESKSRHERELKIARDELQRAMKEVNDLNLGQEHFFRVVGQVYTKSMTDRALKKLDNLQSLPNRLAKLLIRGHAIEILDGDSGEMQSIWIQAIFCKVTKLKPDLKVFVISIIGLQSSGKSTLLNAMFSCRFAVSVGRCSRGLFMRMIFLNEELRKSHGFDCILLIDTEGLCSPEKMNDEKSSQKDRLMATFAMGISNLTIVNILGEGMVEMTEILQIAIIAMARLRSGRIRPDILMVQHLQERNVAKIDQAKGQFCEAINKAFELISKNDVEIGSASAECLDELVTRIHSGDLFKHFGPFRDGSSVNSPPSETYHDDVVDLYETLLNRARNCKTKTMFEIWFHHFESYWNCVKGENFALNFKNVKHLTEFLIFEKKTAKVKEEIDASIRFHREVFSNKIRELIGTLILDKKETITDELRKKLFATFENLLEQLPYACVGQYFYFNVQGEISSDHKTKVDCDACKTFKTNYDNLLSAIAGTEWELDVVNSLKDHRDRLIKVTLNMLRQTFEGSIARQGYFSEFSELIKQELENALSERPHGQYSDEEINIFVDKVWSSLKQIAASKEADPNLSEDFYQAVTAEYAGTDIPERFKSPIILDSLLAENVGWLSSKVKGATNWLGKQIGLSSKVKGATNWLRRHIRYSTTQNTDIKKLNEKQMDTMISDITKTITSVLLGSNDRSKGIEFQRKMVRDIRNAFLEQIKDYELKFKVQLSDICKRDLEIYTLQQMSNRIPASNDISDKINQVLNREYVQNGLLPDILQEFVKSITVEALLELNAVNSEKRQDSNFAFSSDRKLDEKVMYSLKDELDRLVSAVFQNRADNWRTVGLNFEDGMVSEIKNGFPETVKAFENMCGLVLHDNFKRHLEIYTLQNLRDNMIDLQIIWNKENKPSEILEQKRQDYIREITTRLKFGFSAAGEGVIVAQVLCKSIKAIAIQDAYALKIKTVKDVPWTTNAEKVRLQYFEQLASEVNIHEKERALEHFDNPQASIDKWFKEKINSMHAGIKVTEEYEKTLTNELERAIRNIKGSSTKSEIDKIAEDYTKHSDDKYYSKPILKDFNTETFKNSLTRELERYPTSNEGRTIDCPSVTDDPVIMGRLGCTKSCYWCGALCWGSRDHNIGKQTGRKIDVHHACHQPRGLRGTNDRNTKELRVRACHAVEDTTLVYFREFQDTGMLWPIAKSEHFKDWKFDVHCVTAFDELMRWFFQELHVDIAKRRKLLPANKKELEECGCENLKLEKSLEIVRSKI